MIPEEVKPARQSGQAKRDAKKDLLRFEKPVYQLKRNQEGKVESIIAKLMEKREKPQIGIVPRSQLLEQLDRFIPILKQSNIHLLNQQIKPEMQFDAKLQEVEDSSSEDEEQDEMADESNSKMEIEKEKPTYLESVDEFEFNILTYPYLNPKEEGSAQTKQEQEKQAEKQLASKFKKIVEIGSNEVSGQVNSLEKME